ncbi:hypothetical protein A9G02_06190 [Cutibacterium avidum]|nr:hypothetical protein A9G02_06190 [Cutibacterium avidum]
MRQFRGVGTVQDDARDHASCVLDGGNCAFNLVDGRVSDLGHNDDGVCQPGENHGVSDGQHWRGIHH